MRCVATGIVVAEASHVRRPRVVLVARTVEAALRIGTEAPPDEVLFEELPADLAGDGGLAIPVQLPYAAGILARARARFGRLRIDVSGVQAAEREVRLRVLSSAGISGVVADLFALPIAEVERLIDRFLHDPGIGVPIEPLATLLGALVARRNCSLWDLCGPGPTARVFVDSEGRAAATPGDLRAHRLLGTRGDGLVKWRASAAWDAVERFQRALPHARGACMQCTVFHICQGWGAWAGACGQALAALTRLSEAARMLGQERERTGVATARRCRHVRVALPPTLPRLRPNP